MDISLIRDEWVRKINKGLSFYKGSVAKIGQGLLDLLGGIHHERSVRNDRLFERCAGHEHETHTGVRFGFYLEFIAFTEDDQVDCFYQCSMLILIHSEITLAFENIGDSGMSLGDRVAEG